jgi:molybdopterin synthase catalytic subunit
LPTTASGDIYKPAASESPDMKLLAVLGDDTAAASAAERIARELDGSVATVRSDDAAAGPPIDPPAGEVTARYRIGADGAWTGTGTGRRPDGLLDDLASRYDYGLLVGVSDVAAPAVAVGDPSLDDDADLLARAPTADALDVDAVREALAEQGPFETLSSLVATVKASAMAPRAGAIATFTGRVRAKEGPDDDPTEYLEFERYDEVAPDRMDRIERELCEREGVLEVALHHRTGVIEYGEDIVFVVVLAGHRKEAFRTVEDGIDRLKDEVPLFKREVTVDEEFWVHDRE